MNTFESELRRGVFKVGQCPKCNKVMWPPNDFCNVCFGNLTWRQLREPGILVEHSSKDGKAFGIAEFEGSVRIIGQIQNDSELKPGQTVRISKCGYEKTPQITFVVSDIGQN